MLRSVRAVPRIEIEGESDPARVSLFHGEPLGNTAALVNDAHVGFGLILGREAISAQCPDCSRKRPCSRQRWTAEKCQKLPLANLFDHVVRTHQNGSWKCDPEFFGGLHIDGEFQFGWKFDREIGGTGSVQYPVDVSRGAMDARIKIHSIS